MFFSKAGFGVVALFLILMVSGTHPVSSQTTASLFHVQGRIVDPNEAIVVNARISLKPVTGSGSFAAPTNENGEFSISVPENDYTLTVSAPGFVSRSQKISVREQSVSSVEIALAMGGIDAFVTVTGGGEYGVASTTAATKTLTPLRDVPQSISIVGKQQIADQSMASIGDIVRYLPGISAHQGENNRDQIIIRGQSSSADFFVNGVRDDVQYYRDLYNLDRLEALRGPNAMIFGRGGGGGVINRVTKEPSFSSVRQFSLQGGSYGNKRATADLDQRISQKLAFRVNSVYEGSDSYRSFVNLKRFGLNPTMTLSPDAKTTLTFAYEFLRDRRTADRGITSFEGRPADVPLETFYGNPDDSYVRANVNLFSATLDRRFGRLLVHNRTTYGDYDRGYQNYVPGAVNASKTLVSITAYNNATRRHNIFSQTDLIYSLSSGSVRHNLLGGFELGRQTTNNFRNTGYFNNSTVSFLVPYSDPTINVPVIYRQSATDANNHLRTALAAAYVQDQIEISRFLQVVVGARFDYFDLNYHNNRNSDDLKRIDTLISPRLGFVIKPVTDLSLYGSYSISYLPSAGDQFSSLTSITQQLKPERFENIEAGVKWDIRSNLTFTTALYRLDRTNTRSIDPNNPAAIIQTGSQRTNGFELGVNGAITRRWTVTGGYAYQDAFITSATAAAAAGKKVGQVPHHNFSIWNKYQVLSKLSAGLGVITRSDLFAAVDNTVTLPGYTRADAAVFYSFNERWRIQGNIENVFNQRYFLNADGNTNITLGSPRSLRVRLIARF